MIKQVINSLLNLNVFKKKQAHIIVPFNTIINAAQKIKYQPIFNNTLLTNNKGIKSIANAGLQLKEIRNYSPGDDVRLIDANTSARHNEPYVKIYEEYIASQALVAIDISSSIFTKGTSEEQLNIILPCVLLCILTKNIVNTQVVFFSSKIHQVIPFTTNALIAKTVYDFLNNEVIKTNKKSTNFNVLFQYMQQELKSFTEIYIISDGIIPNINNTQLNTQNTLSFNLSKIVSKHVLQFLMFQNNLFSLNKIKGLITFEDAETGKIKTVDASSEFAKDYFLEAQKEQFKYWQKKINNGNSQALILNSSQYILQLQKLFAQRV